MSQTNSQEFTVDGNTYSTTVVNGQVSVISQQDSNGLYTPVDPATDLFTDLSLNDASINAIRINSGEKPYTEKQLADFEGTTGLSKEDWFVENDKWQDEELLTKNYNESLKNYNNALRIENPDNSEDFGKRETKNANPVISVETLRYPYDIDIQQDHLKITQFTYKRYEGELKDKLQEDYAVANGLKYQSSVQKSRPSDSMNGEYQGGVILPMPKVSDSNGA